MNGVPLGDIRPGFTATIAVHGIQPITELVADLAREISTFNKDDDVAVAAQEGAAYTKGR